MTNPPAAIRVSGLHKRYGPTTALEGLDFEIPSGQLTGFLGPNGAGKTTTFRAILGLTRPDQGDIEVLGGTVPAELPAIVKRVGVIVEEPGLIKSLSGRVNLAVAADTLGFGHARIEELLSFVGLADDAGRRVGGYSKGMRQRLALAAALLGDPELLILDEPLDGLDPAGQHAFRDRLRSLAAGGKTVVVSSHVLADIEALADHVVVISQGRLVTQGPLGALLGEGNIRVVVSDKDGAGRVLRDRGVPFHTDDGGLVVEAPDGAEIVRMLAGAGVFPSEIRPEKRTLESVFLGLTGTDVT